MIMVTARVLQTVSVQAIACFCAGVRVRCAAVGVGAIHVFLSRVLAS